MREKTGLYQPSQDEIMLKEAYDLKDQKIA